VGALLLVLDKLLSHIAHPIYMQPDTASLRATLLSGTVTTVTTCATVTSMSQMGGIPINHVPLDTMHAAWAQAVRPRIT
jgi:hypothetical protein